MGDKMQKLMWPVTYVLLIVAVNYGFTVVPLWHGWPPMSLAVGFIFVVRDFAQRQIGHWIWAAMLVAGVLSYLMADPFVAVASVVAFGLSEAADWAVYSFTKRPFAQRVLWSSIVSTPIDSAVFLYLIGYFSWTGVALMTASKLVGAFAVYVFLRRRMVLA